MIARLAQELFDYSERLMRAELSRMPAGEFEAEDFLDDDGLGRRAGLHPAEADD